jgi:two-component system sensor histidine kinase KdpD
MLVRSRLPLRRPRRPSPAGLALAAGGLVFSTLLCALLQGPFGVPTPEVVYLLAVVAVGMAYGSWYAVGTSLVSFALYDFFFVQPRYTFAVASAEQWLDLLLFLVVAIAIGRLSALQLQRRREAELRTSEARALFAMSRDIARSATAVEAAPILAARLVRDAAMARVWIGLGPSVGEERVVADSASAEPRPPLTTRWTLHSSGPDAQPSWARVHETQPVVAHNRPARGPDTMAVMRVPMTAGTEQIGSLWATRPSHDPLPGRSHTRLLAAAADQLAQAVVRDRLADEATSAEVARQGDMLKSALLDSVSHDLRTPLAAIRVAAGSLMDPDVAPPPQEVRAVAGSIDSEADRLSRLVRNMLDLGRIEGEALDPSLELYDLADLVDPVVERFAPALAATDFEIDVPADLNVRVDAIFLDQIVTNLLDNAIRHGGGTKIRFSARRVADRVALTVEDGGEGVSAADLPRIFERFYRAPRRGSRSVGGSGIGLAVVRGLAQAMGGSAVARRSKLGGLAVVVRLLPDEERSSRDEAVEASLGEAAESSAGEAAESSAAEAVESSPTVP